MKPLVLLLSVTVIIFLIAGMNGSALLMLVMAPPKPHVLQNQSKIRVNIRQNLYLIHRYQLQLELIQTAHRLPNQKSLALIVFKFNLMKLIFTKECFH